MNRLFTPLGVILTLVFVLALLAADQPPLVVAEQGNSPLKPASDMTEAQEKALVESLLAEMGLRAPGKWNFPSTAFEYAKMAKAELGVPPRIDLSQAVEIPLFVTGVRTVGEDRPHKGTWNVPFSETRTKWNGKGLD